jgi:integrase
MTSVLKHAHRHGLLPQTVNPAALARCKTTSGYVAKIVTPEQMIAILDYLDTPVTRMEYYLALTCAATALRGEEVFGLQWGDILWDKSQILIQRAWSKGKQTAGKNEHSMSSVPLHPALAEHLQAWRRETLYAKNSDWVFASVKEKGRIPRSASICSKDYLRPAAVKAGVLTKADNTRFGWHSLRHSLATFLAPHADVKTVQSILRHKRQSTTTDLYMHGQQKNQLEAQGMFLSAIKKHGSQMIQ